MTDHRATLYGHLQGLRAHVARTTRAADLAGMPGLAVDLADVQALLTKYLTENEQLLRATAPPVRAPGRPRSRKVGA